MNAFDWIDARAFPPAENQRVLAYCSGDEGSYYGAVKSAVFRDGRFQSLGNANVRWNNVTYWQPLVTPEDEQTTAFRKWYDEQMRTKKATVAPFYEDCWNAAWKAAKGGAS